MPVTLLDAEGNSVTVDDAEAREGLLTGRLRAGADRVRLVRADGTAGEVARDQLSSALAQTDEEGRPVFGFDTPARQEERRLEAEFGDRAITAGAAGVARGATLGISDQIATAIGGDETAEALRELQRRNEGVSTGSEIAGSLLPLLLSRGRTARFTAPRTATLAARLLRGLSGPSRLAIGAGELAEAGAGALLRSGTRSTLARRVLARAGETAVGGAVEGGLFGAGEMISESALGEEDLTAEQVIAGVGLNALLGGVGSGVFGGGSALLGEGVRGAAGLARSGRDVVARAWQSRTGRELVPGVADLYARTASLASGADEGVVRRFVDLGPEGRRAREVVQRGDDVYETGTRQLSDALTAIEPTTRHVADFWGAGLKERQVRRVIDATNVDAQGRAALEALEAAQRVADDIAENPALFTGPGGAAQGRNLRRTLDARRQIIEEAIARGGDDATGTATTLFRELDQLKRDIGRFQQRASRDPEATRMFRGLYDDQFRPLLERADLWGEGAARMQSDVNASFTRWLTRRGDFERMFLAEGERDTVDAFRRLAEADPARIASFLRNAGRAGNERAERTFREVLEAQQGLVETMGRHLDLPTELQAGTRESRRATERALRQLDSVREQAAILNQFRELSGAGGIERSVIGAAVGAAAGGPVGALAAGALASPAQTVRVLSVLDRLRGQSDQAIARSVRGYLGRGARAVQEAGREATTRARRAIPPITVGAFEDKVREYMEISDPETATRRLGERTEQLSGDAPRTQMAMQRTAIRAADYVRSRIPVRSQQAHLVPGRLGVTRPTHSEIASFLRTVRAVENPLVLLDELDRGRLSRESVDAVRAVYPRIYSRLLDEVQTNLAERAAAGRPVPYRQRLQLGILLGAPTDPSLRPEAIASIQSSYAARAAAQPPRRAASTQVPDFSSDLLTTSQRIEQRA